MIPGCLPAVSLRHRANAMPAFVAASPLPACLPARLQVVTGDQTRLYSSPKKRKKQQRRQKKHEENVRREEERRDPSIALFNAEFEKALTPDGKKLLHSKNPPTSPKKGQQPAPRPDHAWSDGKEAQEAEEEFFAPLVAKPFVPATDEPVVAVRKYSPPNFAKLTKNPSKIARVENWVPAVDESAYRRQVKEENLDQARKEWAYWLQFKKRRMRTSDPKERAFIRRMQHTRPPPPPEEPSDGRPAIRRPSAASGGVPEPTLAYLSQAMDPVRDPFETPQPLLVVLDLNGTLLHRPQRRDKPSFFAQRRHASRFLQYCLDTYWVVIWSSARAGNVERILQQLLPRKADRDRLVAVWAREHFGLCPADFNQRVQCYKRLSWLWADPTIAQTHPDYAQGGRWSQANTALVDDSLEKARTEPHNIIAIPEYLGTDGDQTDVSKDRVLPEVHDYLHKLCFQADVSAYMRKNPFRAVSGLGR